MIRSDLLIPLFASVLAAAYGCSSPDSQPRAPASGDSGGAGSTNSGTGGTAVVVTTPTGVDPLDKRDVPIRKKVCDTAGKCTCLRLALLGTLESAALLKDTQPFISWLNDNSGGTATVTMVSQKPTIDAAFLTQYDILLIANVNAWTFSAAEKAAVEVWARETGGGIISLTGFVSTDAEPAATSQLIEFSGIRYNSTKAAPAEGELRPVYYKGGTTDLKKCLHWAESGDAHITTPIQFQAQTGAMAKLTHELTYVGAFIGWGVTAPAAATVVAKDPVSGANIAVAYERDGKGRIFAFGDEWVIFANQWVPKGFPDNRQMDQGNICWHPATGSAPGFFHSSQTLYQVKQFWYDAINWVAPPNQCNFIVDDPDVIIVPR